MLTALAAPHVWLDDTGRAWVDDTNVKVIEIALDHLAYGWSAGEIHAQHPGLSLAQIHAALAHYYDHQAEFDRQIEAGRHRAEMLAADAGDTPLRRRCSASSARLPSSRDKNLR